MKRDHAILLTINIVLIIGFGAAFLARRNFEFVIYIGIIVFFLGLLGLTIRKVDYTRGALVGLTVWSAMHMAGGGIPVDDGRLYDVILWQLPTQFPILRYDQVVHMWGFGAATLVMYCLLRRPLARKSPTGPMEPNGEPLPSGRRSAEVAGASAFVRHPVALGIVIVMAGLGAGALNEILEFAVSTAVPESGVGGYENTSLDLVADLIGALAGLAYIRVRY